MRRIIEYFVAAEPRQKMKLPAPLWGGLWFLAGTSFQFQLYVLGREGDRTHSRITWSNVNGTFKRSAMSITHLLTTLTCPTVILYSLNHYYMPTFYLQPNMERMSTLHLKYDSLLSNVQTARFNDPIGWNDKTYDTKPSYSFFGETNRYITTYNSNVTCKGTC
jgi:hypothetical protein